MKTVLRTLAVLALLGAVSGSRAEAQSTDAQLIEKWETESLELATRAATPGNCKVMPTVVQYRPALKACHNNAAIIASGPLKGVFSIQLRDKNGNDRLDPNCGRNDCSPYKVQNFITSKTSKIGCFGARGNAKVMKVVKYTTLKRTAVDHTPLAYCIADPAKPIN